MAKVKTAAKSARGRKAAEILSDIKEIRYTLADPNKTVKLQWQLAPGNGGGGGNSARGTPERSEAENAMLAAIEEINSLRRQNEVLRAKVDTMNLFDAMLFARPAEVTNGAAEDVAWELRRAINNMNATKEPANG